MGCAQGSSHAVGAAKNINVPVVMTREAVTAVVSLMDGATHVVTRRLDGSGLYIREAVRLRAPQTGSPPSLLP